MSIKRFGSRYGKRVRDRLAAIEKISKHKQLCPFCRKPKVRRLSIGIFQCDKCNKKFTGKAYMIEKPKPVEIKLTKVKEEIIEETDEIKPQRYKDAPAEEPKTDVPQELEEYDG